MFPGIAGTQLEVSSCWTTVAVTTSSTPVFETGSQLDARNMGSLPSADKANSDE